MLSPLVSPPSYDPVFVLLSIPVLLALLALVYAWVKKRLEKRNKKEDEEKLGDGSPPVLASEDSDSSYR